MNVLNAVNRLVSESQVEEGSLRNQIDGSVELDARFDKGREPQLRKIQGFLRSRGLLFSLKEGALFRRTHESSIEWEGHEVIRHLNEFGCGMNVQQSIMRNRIWAMSGHGGITLQRLRCEFRIFYTTR